MPTRFKGARLEQIDPAIWLQIEKALHSQDDLGLFISGPTGSGKTHLAVAAMLFLPQRDDEEFVSVPVMLAELRESCRPGAEWSETDIVVPCIKAPLLILDDLGSEKTTDYALQVLYLIINQRYAAMRQTIITSNLGLRGIAEKLGDRIASRIAGMCRVMELQGEDRRITAR